MVGGGAAEPVGVADGFASLAEAWTTIVLGLYLANPSASRHVSVFGLGAPLALGLAWLWLIAADAGIFNADAARLAAAQPALVDWLVASAGVALAGSLLIGARAPLHRPWLRGLLRGLTGTFALSSVALVWLTLPPTVGQNVDCRYAPLSTVLIGGHAGASKPVILATGAQRILPLFELHACGSERDVALDGVEPVTIMGAGATVDGFWLLPVGIRLNAQGQEALPAQARSVPPGDRIEAGRPRQLVVRLVGTGAGDYILGSVRLGYHTRAPGAFTFATQITVCSGNEPGASPTATGLVTFIRLRRGCGAWLARVGARGVRRGSCGGHRPSVAIRSPVAPPSAPPTVWYNGWRI
ncbi:MAG: hypothetical protein H0W81_11745 [Chloroflexi bacterium]|nr:hypothetical protein [Chloroflexota bacterium]